MNRPSREIGEITGPTSHIDFPATLLELMGVTPPGREAWTPGGNLFAPRRDRSRVMGGWNELGVWTRQAILRVPLARFEFDVVAFDYRWNLMTDDGELLRERA